MSDVLNMDRFEALTGIPLEEFLAMEKDANMSLDIPWSNQDLLRFAYIANYDVPKLISAIRKLTLLTLLEEV